MTTNHPEVLDSALIRPGRIDCKFSFDNCDAEQIGKLFEMFFNQELSDINKNQLDNLVLNKNYSPAHITSIFLRYRNNPEVVLEHLDDEDNKFDTNTSSNIDCDGNMNVPDVFNKT